ncbi:MAG TPA: DUF1501 domain-containing protein [Thermoanaerobaculia bacterium]|nr:DUF1501 domain-containing protein [Thermoanaerobaculia bacterium]
MKTLLPSLQASGATPVTGRDLSRRGFLQLGGAGLVASWFLKSPAAAWAAESAEVVTRSSARNVIFVFLPGAPSQIDTWDLKEGAWTPPDFAPADFGSGLRFPAGLMPNLAEHLGDVAIVRSMMSHALVHGLGQTWLQISRNPTGATGSEAPNMGSVAALELDGQRTPDDVLPAFLSLNTQPNLSGAGYFPSTYAPFVVQPTAAGLPSLTPPDGAARLQTRWNDLQELDAALRTGQPLGKDAADAVNFYDQAKILIDTPAVNDLFKVGASDAQRYGSSTFGNGCLVAKQLLAGARGARFVMVSVGGWDMHSNIYTRAAATNLYTQMGQLDPALASLIGDLKAAPGRTAGNTLFDETLVVVAGEFGRTVGNLNGQAGRDHFAVYSAVFAGGGVRGGQVIGATDATGTTIADSGVPGRTELRAEDLACTVYSALGIDWTTMRHDDPLGRGFEYVPDAAAGVYAPIDRLFG